MELYCILLIAIGYFAMWTITSIIIGKMEKDSDFGAFMGFIWPITLPLTLITWFTKKFVE